MLVPIGQAFPGCVWSGRNFKREQNLGCKACAHGLSLMRGGFGSSFQPLGKTAALVTSICYNTFATWFLYLKNTFLYTPLLFVGSYPWTAVFPRNRQRVMIQQQKKNSIQTKRYTILRPSTRDYREEIFSCYWFGWQAGMWALDDKTRK